MHNDYAININTSKRLKKIDRVQIRRDTSDLWEKRNPILFEGEIGYDINLNKLKIGNGRHSWNSLAFLDISNISLVDYRSSFDDNYIYSGFLLNNGIIIKRSQDNVEEFAENTTDLEVDWSNRLNLTYN
jgi:hypothetical protein|tara:strand:- start:217 stop:603 length:387 start_codon:yes stop_codon:yes gene_type:complete